MPLILLKNNRAMKEKRSIISIDESLCNGCGACVSGCREGALQMIDGKGRIISELYCDGLGACIGECPVGAITIEEREAEPYDERAVMERIAAHGETTIIAHLKHLKEHGETLYLQQGIDYLREHDIRVDLSMVNGHQQVCGCPGSAERSFGAPHPIDSANLRPEAMRSQLTHWPIQLHLLNPEASFFRGADVVLAADCTAYAYPDFHNRFLRNHKLAIACPKLDSNKESYVAKIAAMIDSAQINTLTVVIMEVPCCGGLVQLAKMAAAQAQRKVPIKRIIIGIDGEIKKEDWMRLP
jgi:ferredoxin